MVGFSSDHDYLLAIFLKFLEKRAQTRRSIWGAVWHTESRGFHKIDFPFSFGQKNRIFRQEIKSKN